jgi:hypothetical protein
MALALLLGKADTPPHRLSVEATVTLDDVDGVPTIVSSALRVDGWVSQLDAAGFQKFVDEAIALCAPSRGCSPLLGSASRPHCSQADHTSHQAGRKPTRHGGMRPLDLGAQALPVRQVVEADVPTGRSGGPRPGHLVAPPADLAPVLAGGIARYRCDCWMASVDRRPCVPPPPGRR